MFHSDHGSVYASKDYARLCTQLAVTQSMGAIGSSADNALAESFNATLKREILAGAATFPDQATAYRAVFRWATRYNTRRRHSAIGSIPPPRHLRDHRHRYHRGSGTTQPTPCPRTGVKPRWRGDATEHVLTQIERFAPGLRDRIVATSVRNPGRIQLDNANFVGGDIITGANTPRQLVLRPRATLAPYATGTPGVFLCSAATPPGAGAHGMCGYHAARAALAYLAR